MLCTGPLLQNGLDVNFCKNSVVLTITVAMSLYANRIRYKFRIQPVVRILQFFIPFLDLPADFIQFHLQSKSK